MQQILYSFALLQYGLMTGHWELQVIGDDLQATGDKAF